MWHILRANNYPASTSAPLVRGTLSEDDEEPWTCLTIIPRTALSHRNVMTGMIIRPTVTPSEPRTRYANACSWKTGCSRTETAGERVSGAKAAYRNPDNMPVSAGSSSPNVARHESSLKSILCATLRASAVTGRCSVRNSPKIRLTSIFASAFSSLGSSRSVAAKPSMTRDRNNHRTSILCTGSPPGSRFSSNRQTNGIHNRSISASVSVDTTSNKKIRREGCKIPPPSILVCGFFRLLLLRLLCLLLPLSSHGFYLIHDFRHSLHDLSDIYALSCRREQFDLVF